MSTAKAYHYIAKGESILYETISRVAEEKKNSKI
jgi:hypothetical protein